MLPWMTSSEATTILELGGGAFGTDRRDQPAPATVRGAVLPLQEAQHHLLSDQAQPVLSFLRPGVPVGEPAEEIVNGRQGRLGQVDPQFPGAGAR